MVSVQGKGQLDREFPRALEVYVKVESKHLKKVKENTFKRS